jgi:hypothetical protein
MRRFILAAASVLLLGFPSEAQQSNPFPAGASRDLIAVACTQCHRAGPITQLRMGEAGWRRQVYNMVLRGAQIGPDEIDDVVKYLATNFGPGVPVPGVTPAPVKLPDGAGRTLSPAPAGPATASTAWSPSRVPAGSGKRSCTAWLPSGRQSMPTRPGRSSPICKRITAPLRQRRRNKPSLSARGRDQPTHLRHLRVTIVRSLPWGRNMGSEEVRRKLRPPSRLQFAGKVKLLPAICQPGTDVLVWRSK